jgi:hypothetical protein
MRTRAFSEYGGQRPTPGPIWGKYGANMGDRDQPPFSDAPGLTRSMHIMHIAQHNLDRDSLWVAHRGEGSWTLAQGIEAVAFNELIVRLGEL